MNQCIYLAFLFFFLSGCQAQTKNPLVGTYEYRDSTVLLLLHQVHKYTVGENDIAFVRSNFPTGARYWKGRYEVRDSLLEVLIYYSGNQDGNVGHTWSDTRQQRLTLTIREEEGNPLLIRKYPKMVEDSMSLLMGSLRPSTEAFAKVVDTVLFYPPPVADCNGYGNYERNPKWSEGEPCDSIGLAEQRVFDLLTIHLNQSLPELEVEEEDWKPPSVTALLKIREVPDFSISEVTIVENSSPYDSRMVATALRGFLKKNKHQLNDPSLQDCLLVVMAITGDGICVLPPQSHIGMYW